MLIAALAIWLTLVIFFVAICRLAANADRRDDVALTERYLSHSIRGSRTLTTSTTSSTGQGRRVRATMTGRSGELLQ